MDLALVGGERRISICPSRSAAAAGRLLPSAAQSVRMRVGR
jgi:hypothetical protein